ncbi:MAG: 2-isopropylmalate synthase [Magnetococcales bacterium]|nr:2-isopropylmalate synthase [Magnetococcales bacterium]
MNKMPCWKYEPFPAVDLPDRRWPSQVITRAPTWCSVDLRDGNQALVNPMNPDQKQRLFDLLVALGLKEIEIGFPAASRDDFEFTRRLIEDERIPDDVTVQVLVQAREHLIERTFEALRGARRAVVHLYNSTSPLQRRVVFGMEPAQIVELARSGTAQVREWVEKMPDTDIRLEYSPESFSATELEFSLEISEAVLAVWQPTAARPMILNLPSTVEMATPNVYADQIEWFLRHLPQRDRVILSVHAHNDRGTAVAATELALMAGADRVEGTLFGNGERTGNVDLLTVAMNLFSQGIDPQLDFSDMNRVVATYRDCVGMAVSPRHPYAGELVFTAFSGSHQDAIRKGMAARKKQKGGHWQVPYLPIDPADVGRAYDPVIRINSQSGKGGVAFVLEDRFGYRLPRLLQVDFSRLVQEIADGRGRELKPTEIDKTFRQTYIDTSGPFRLAGYEPTSVVMTQGGDQHTIRALIDISGRRVAVSGTGNGPVSAFVAAMQRGFGLDIKVLDYEQHAMGEGDHAEAVTYMRVTVNGSDAAYGIGKHVNTSTSALQAVINAVNRSGDWSDDEAAFTIRTDQ